MATSSNAKIQQLMDEVDQLDNSDGGLEAKLEEIARKVAAEQQRMKQAASGQQGDDADDSDLIDPADAFACEGCQ